MEQEQYYLRIGIFTTLVSVLALVVIGWFSASNHKEARTPYGIYFDGSVDGVSLGSPVRLKGITVGNVTEIGFDPHDNNRIFMRINITERAPIRADTVASVQALGITGTSFISLDSDGTDSTPNVTHGDEPYPIIASKKSSLEKVFSSIPEVLDAIKKLSMRGEAFLNDDNITAFNSALKSIDASAKSIEKLTGSADARSLASVMQQLNESLVESKFTLREIRMLARTLREDPSLIIAGPQHTGKQVP